VFTSLPAMASQVLHFTLELAHVRCN